MIINYILRNVVAIKINENCHLQLDHGTHTHRNKPCTLMGLLLPLVSFYSKQFFIDFNVSVIGFIGLHNVCNSLLSSLYLGTTLRLRSIKSSLSKSMQPSIYPVGRGWTFSTAQFYTAESIRAAMLMIFTVV